MKQKRALTELAAAAAMLILILDGKTAVQGARDGIHLCLYSVIPALFPFCVLSQILMAQFPSGLLPILRPLGKLCKLPDGAEPLLIPAFFGGYPMGAQCVGQAYQDRRLSQEQAQNLLQYCSNAGPAFLFGMLCTLFPSPAYLWLLWFIHMTSAILVAQTIPSSETKAVPLPKPVTQPITVILRRCVITMGMICGWVVLFRILISYLTQWILKGLPQILRPIVSGLLELTNGCWELSNVAGLKMRFFLCSAMLAFGGLCVAMQTKSVIGGLSLKSYFQGKVKQTFFSLLMCGCLFLTKWSALCFSTLCLSVIIWKKRKNGSNPGRVGV